MITSCPIAAAVIVIVVMAASVVSVIFRLPVAVKVFVGLVRETASNGLTKFPVTFSAVETVPVTTTLVVVFSVPMFAVVMFAVVAFSVVVLAVVMVAVTIVLAVVVSALETSVVIVPVVIVAVPMTAVVAFRVVGENVVPLIVVAVTVSARTVPREIVAPSSQFGRCPMNTMAAIPSIKATMRLRFFVMISFLLVFWPVCVLPGPFALPYLLSVVGERLPT